MEWKVFVADFNSASIIEYNPISDGFLKANIKFLYKTLSDREAFEKELNSCLMYQYWSRYEYEVIISDLFDKSRSEEKVDVYRQIKMNWGIFIDYVWSHRDEIEKIYKDIQKQKRKAAAQRRKEKQDELR